MTVLLFALLSACVRPAPLPEVGDCANYPDGVYEFGEIGIGTCLAGPVEAHFLTDGAGELALVVVNSNAHRVFSGGSVLSLPWAEVEAASGDVAVHTLSPASLPLPSFVAGLTPAPGGLGIVPARLSPDARVRQTWDDVLLLDLEDPFSPALSGRGTGGGAAVRVQSDPVDAVVDPASGYAFVANRTSHSISVLDVAGDEVQVLRPWPTQVLGTATFDDADGSGSNAALAGIAALEGLRAPDDNWSFTWVEGASRVWWPGAEGGLERAESPGDGVWVRSALGVELDPADSGGLVSVVDDPAYLDGGRMFFSDGTRLRAASASAFLGDWSFEAPVLLGPRAEAWDATLGGPSPIVADDVLWLFYDGGGRESAGIGAARSTDGNTFLRVDDAPLLVSAGAHDAVALADPHVARDNETGLYHLVYSAYDGARWSIGHAISVDLLTWSPDPLPLLDEPGVDLAAPTLAIEPGGWVLYVSRDEGAGWEPAAATSADGRTWSESAPLAGIIDAPVLASEPPGLALGRTREFTFRARGEAVGSIAQPVQPGVPFVAVDLGWQATAVAGYTLGEDALGAASAGGIQLDSVAADGRVVFTATAAGGATTLHLGTADGTTGAVSVASAPLPVGGGAFARDGVRDGVLVALPNGGYHLWYAGVRGTTVSLGLATSADGLTWEDAGQRVRPGDDWDSVALVPTSAEPTADGRYTLWVSGSDGEVWRIGALSVAAASGNARRVNGPGGRGWVFGPGMPGTWSDAGVRDAWVQPGTNASGQPGLHLWYAGTDGLKWRIGHAFRRDGRAEFEEAVDPLTLAARPVVAADTGLFDLEAVQRPVVLADDLGGFSGWYSAPTQGISRVGRLSGRFADRLARVYARPTPGDVLRFTTERGDPEALAIPLDTFVDGFSFSGTTLTRLTLDAERGVLWAAPKGAPYLFAVDIRDDSSPAFADANYLDVEAVLLEGNASQAIGFRDLVPRPGTSLAYSLNLSPEGVWVHDLGGWEDGPFGHVLQSTVVGFLPASRGIARDRGLDTRGDVGPAALLFHPDGERLFVINFNANSVGVYDLRLGPWGTLVAEVDAVGEAPWSMALSPDGRRLVVVNSIGGVEDRVVPQATLAVLDVDPSSPTYLDVLATVGNR